MLHHYIRTSLDNTTAFADTILEYATLSLTSEVRLAVTKRYHEGDAIPDGSCNLIVNSPMLYAVAKLQLPGVRQETFVVLDYPGLTMQRAPRESEVLSLVADLNKQALGKVTYVVQPIGATNALTPEQAVKAICAADYADLSPQSENDFLDRLR